MELSELVKIKPGTIIWVEVEELRSGDDEILVAERQEVCLAVKSVAFFPSRKDVRRVEINFESIELSGDAITKFYQISIRFRDEQQLLIAGVIDWEYEQEAITDNILISSIKIE